ncbi:unnamed protein product [Darwinula stevensoni]|uniref:Aspartate aminotransferase family protein n=1 Tax=Darwinula stevensoni TaxID=69355 RepID=A0A7R9A903_9CRUS|nr:unnamed protein product [Darwinula stevensoni]CAG0896966.1 unnamed protein product [Darwinula stevensoni]
MTNRQLFFQHIAQTSTAPMALEIARAEGLYLYDTTGKAYFDLISGIGVSVLGHRHEAVQHAVQQQLDRYWHTLVYGEMILQPQVALATLLAEKTNHQLDAVFFTNSGSEATEGAMKLAKRYTGRAKIFACPHAYHGSTQGAASLMSPTFFTDAYRPLLPNIHHIRYNNLADLDAIDESTACVIVETVQAESGLHSPNAPWIQALRARCTQVGALLILDEIQAAYGRTGKLFAYEHYGIVPDVLLLAKGFGGGMPIGAFLASKKVMDVLSYAPPLGNITTFGGHPVCAAAALATLQTILASNLIAQVPVKEKLFLELMVHPEIKEVRSAGLWLAVELHGGFPKVLDVIKKCLERGIITDWFLFNDCSLRIAPPLTIEEADIRWVCGEILACM